MKPKSYEEWYEANEERLIMDFDCYFMENGMQYEYDSDYEQAQEKFLQEEYDKYCADYEAYCENIADGFTRETHWD